MSSILVPGRRTATARLAYGKPLTPTMRKMSFPFTTGFFGRPRKRCSRIKISFGSSTRAIVRARRRGRGTAMRAYTTFYRDTATSTNSEGTRRLPCSTSKGTSQSATKPSKSTPRNTNSRKRKVWKYQKKTSCSPPIKTMASRGSPWSTTNSPTPTSLDTGTY